MRTSNSFEKNCHPALATTSRNTRMKLPPTIFTTSVSGYPRLSKPAGIERELLVGGNRRLARDAKEIGADPDVIRPHQVLHVVQLAEVGLEVVAPAQQGPDADDTAFFGDRRHVFVLEVTRIGP